MINVVFFAALREQLSCEAMTIEANAVDAIKTVEQVKQAVLLLKPEWQSYLANTALLYAVNKELVSNQHPVTAGDEVAFFPPVTGG
jgi:molybdopterin synthase sulfur carrier subunit